MKARTPHSHFSIAHFIEWSGVYLFIILIVAGVGVFVARELKEKTLPAGYVNLTTDKQIYALGENVKFTITNNFSTPVYVANSCPNEPLNVYRWESSRWVAIHDTASSSACTNEQRQVVIGASSFIKGSYSSWPRLFKQAGLYRITASINNYKGVPSTDFQITEAGPTNEHSKNDVPQHLQDD